MTTLRVGRGRGKHNKMLGELLAEARSQHRLTQTEVAEAAGVSRTMLCGIEKGRETPSVLSLTRLLTVLGEEFQVADDSVTWANHTIVCPRFSRYRLTGPPDRQVVPPADERSEGGYIQILDWR